MAGMVRNASKRRQQTTESGGRERARQGGIRLSEQARAKPAAQRKGTRAWQSPSGGLRDQPTLRSTFAPRMR